MKFRLLFILSLAMIVVNYLPLRSEEAVDERKVFQIFSENEKYYFKTMMQGNRWDKRHLGITKIFKTENDSMLYYINRFFEVSSYPENLFLSNDGKTLIYITNSAFDDCNTIHFYKDGILSNKINVNDVLFQNEKYITKCDNNLYSNPEIRIKKSNAKDYKSKRRNEEEKFSNRTLFEYADEADSTEILADMCPVFISEDDLFFVKNNKETVSININNYSIQHYEFSPSEEIIITKAKFIRKVFEVYKMYDLLHYFPNKEDFGNYIAEKIGWKFDLEFNPMYYYDVISFDGYLNFDSTFYVFNISNDIDDVSDEFILELVKNYKFDVANIPNYTERWYIQDALYFRNPIDSLALSRGYKYDLKREEEVRNNPTLDSIEGKYIPKDLYEAIKILDENLSSDEKDKIKHATSRNDMWKLHYDLDGLGVTSDWKIWKNSRFNVYLQSLGLYIHFEDLRTFILEPYLCYLKNEPFYLPKLKGNRFKLDSNIVVSYTSSLDFEKEEVHIYSSNIIRKDSVGIYRFHYAFPKSDSVNNQFSYFQANNEIEKEWYYSDASFAYDIESLKPDFVLNQSFYNIDSLLFIEYRDYNLTNILYDFKKIIDKSNQNFVFSNSYYVFLASQAELDSLDNIFIDINKGIRRINPNSYSSGEAEQHNAILNAFLNNKRPYKLSVVFLYPYLEFNFNK